MSAAERAGTDLTLRALGGDAAAIAARVDAVLAEPLLWIPVRHHSPATARATRALLRWRRPKIVFVEAPVEAQALVPHLIAPATRPPVAIYSSFRDDEDVLGMRGIWSAAEDVPVQLPSFYPMTTYSPEYVAVLTAKEIGADVVFVDLPHWAVLAWQLARRPLRERAPVAPPDEAAVRDPEALGKAPLHELIASSELVERLARAGGFRHWNEAWDALFEPLGEPDPSSLERWRRELATFCSGVRASTPLDRLGADDTLPRERFMWSTIRRTLAERGVEASEAAFVCGGFHLFLDRDDPEEPPPIPEGTVRSTLVPYSFPRLATFTGYAAGNRAPAWYQRLFEDRGGSMTEIVMAHVVDVLGRARRKGAGVATADTLAVVHHAHLLGQLRGRGAPVLDDVADAVLTCCCKGDPAIDGAPLSDALREIGTGTRVGEVTPAVGLLPLVIDFRERARANGIARLIEHEEPFTVVIDKRDAADAARSALLHRLRYLGAPIGTLARDEDPFAQTIFKERWRLSWAPELEPKLVEESLHGDTVETAATAKLVAALAGAGHDAAKCTRELLAAIDMDLPTLVHRAEDAAGAAIDRDERFHSLVQAFAALQLLERYAIYRELRREALEGLLSRAYARACFAAGEAASVPEEEQPQVIEALKILADAVLRRDELDADLFAVQARAAAEASASPLLRGAFLGLLVEIRKLPVTDLAGALATYAHGTSERQLEAGDFLAGALAVSRTAIMIGGAAIVGAVDEVLRAVSPDAFLAMVPRLRAAFEQLPRSQRLSLAGQVARRYGEREESVTFTLGASVETAALLAELDAEVAELLEGWDLA